MKWHVLGGGPSAEGVQPLAGAITITTNAGILKWPYPDYYFVADPIAVQRWEKRIAHAQKMKTHIITYNMAKGQTWNEKVANTVLELPIPQRKVFHGRRGVYQFTGWSGPIIVQFALFNGATQLRLDGFEGRHHTPWNNLNSRAQSELFSRLREAYSEVEWL